MTNTKKGGVVISPNPVKTRVVIDINGNQIDLRTKRIIRHNNEK